MLYFSLRDINFTPTTDGVRIICTTDVPCHLYCRLSSQEPRIHKRPIYRRGTWLNDDVRFCFTVFEDNEQFESGDTLIHTFWKTNWPYCTTKWSYYFASISGNWCVSTSPYFKYHNDGVDPVYPPDVMFTFNSIEPELHSCGAGGVWNSIDLQHDVPPDATGIIYKVFTTPVSGDKKVGFRPHGTVNDNTGRLRGGEGQWGVCGLYDHRWIEAFGPVGGNVDFWVLGYTGRNVHFLDPVINLTPSLSLSWEEVDVSPYIPAGAIPIFDLSHQGYAWKRYAVRPKGSTFRVWARTAHNWIIISPDANGIVEFFMEAVGPTKFQLLLTGFIDGGGTYHQLSIDRTPAGLAAWDNVPVTADANTSKWVILEVGNTAINVDHGVRKKDSLRDHKRECGGHGWVYAHTNPTPMVQIYRPSVDFVYWEYGVTT